jgi:hypothetical protein
MSVVLLPKLLRISFRQLRRRAVANGELQAPETASALRLTDSVTKSEIFQFKL